MKSKKERKSNISDIDAQLRGIKHNDKAEMRDAKNALFNAKLIEKQTDGVWVSNGKTTVKARPERLEGYLSKGFKVLKR